MTDETDSRRRILLVEDEPDLSDNYTLALGRAGFDVEAQASVADCLAAVAVRIPDVVLLDIGLGAHGEAGFDLCRLLRQDHPKLPIIFLSARESDLDVVSGLRLGADDYLTKSVSLAHIKRIRAKFTAIDASFSGIQTVYGLGYRWLERLEY